MIGFAIGIVKIIFLLGFLIFIHELGHFTAAKLCNVKVEEFSIGFGPIIWKKQGKETKYELRLIPLGGFVNMQGEEKRVDNERSFSNASLPKRMAIVLAGPIVNIVFAVVVCYIVALTQGTYVSNEIEKLIPQYAAETSGIKAGDKILEIEGKKVDSGEKVGELIQKTQGREIGLKILRDNETKEVRIKPTEEIHKVTGIYLDEELKVIMVQKGSSAEKAGIRANDKILKINGVKKEELEENIEKLMKIVKDNENIQIEIEREGKTIEFNPDKLSKYYIGVVFKEAEDNALNRIIGAGKRTKVFIEDTINNVKQLFTGKVGINQMMGPVGIGESVAKTRGIEEFISMMTLISISLGITNLLPIPALDGGKMLLLIIEGIRRKPLKEETEIKIQLIGFALLITIAIIVTYNDILRIF